MKRRCQTLRFCFILLPALLWLAACGSPTPIPEDGALQLEYDFPDGAAGWESGFADLPSDYDPAIYELEAGFTQLPGELEGNGLCIQGHNRSDDLFMFFKTQIEGLRPETPYETGFRDYYSRRCPVSTTAVPMLTRYKVATARIRQRRERAIESAI